MSERIDEAATLSRRDWLQRVAVPAVAAVGLAACSDSRRYVVDRRTPGGATRHFVPVQVTKERLIRSYAGLRPYRAAGFRLEAERLDGKQLIHNYGHGGGGMTLSWGTANLAVDLMQGNAPARSVAVVGAGVVGLSTAVLLLRQGFDVTIYAAKMPPHTTSNASAATFFPSHVIAEDQVTAAFEQQLEVAVRTSFHAYQRLAGDRYGVRWVDAFYLSDGKPSDGKPSVETRVSDLVANSPMHDLARGDTPFDAPKVRQARDLLIEPPIYLRALVDDVRSAGGRFVIRRLEAVRDLAQLPHATVFNCTGLGARTLVKDAGVLPARGQIAVIQPDAGVDYTLYHGDFGYMMPRKDGILLGGTFDVGVDTTTPDPAIEARLLAAHAKVFDAMK